MQMTPHFLAFEKRLDPRREAVSACEKAGERPNSASLLSPLSLLHYLKRRAASQYLLDGVRLGKKQQRQTLNDFHILTLRVQLVLAAASHKHDYRRWEV